MALLGRCLRSAAVVSVHLVDCVRAVVGAHDRALALVLDRQDHRLVEDLASADRELDDDAHARLVVERVAMVRTHVCVSSGFASAVTNSSTDAAIWNARVKTAA